jgi:hypothetical protein
VRLVSITALSTASRPNKAYQGSAVQRSPPHNVRTARGHGEEIEDTEPIFSVSCRSMHLRGANGQSSFLFMC